MNDSKDLPRRPSLAVIVAIVSIASIPGVPLRSEDLGSFLKKVQDPDDKVRRSAWERAEEQGAEAVAPLAGLMAGADRNVVLAATLAVRRLAHASAAPDGGKRKETALALAALLSDPKAPERVKLEALDLLGSVGGAESVPAIRTALRDGALQDVARKALERIPGEESAKALEAAVPEARGEIRSPLILSLGKKKALSALDTLKKLASDPAEPARIAAAKALARLGEPEGLPAIREALEGASPRDRKELTGDLLQMAGDLVRAGKRDAARRVLGDIAAGAPEESQRYAAVFAIAGEDPARQLETVLRALDDPSERVRSLALELLGAARGEAVEKAVLERFASAKGGAKAALLRAIAARKTASWEKSIEEALADPDLEVKVTALELSGKIGDPSREGLLVEAMEKGSPAVKASASRAYLGLADAKLDRDPKEAGKMYARVLDYSRDGGEQGKALIGLAKVGDPGSLCKIEAARKNPVLSRSANEACVILAKALGKAGKKEEAAAMLLSVANSKVSREVAASAVAGLKDLGVDPAVTQKKRGFVSTWFVVGPFPNENGRGFDTKYSPEEEVRLDSQKDHKGRSRKWEEVSANAEGIVDLARVFQRTNDVCAYAYGEIDAKEARDVRLKVGSDDGVVCWLNGKKVHAMNAVRPLQADQDVVDARLEAGKNKILVKVTQGGGQWEFCVRVTDRKDEPVDLSAPGK